MDSEADNNLSDTVVQKHLRNYLKRTQELWKIYNTAMDHWKNRNPSAAGVPVNGSFPEVGISSFSRHGLGIQILCGKEIIEFDFIPKYIKKEDYMHIEEIDIYWSYVHFRSIYPNTMITEEMWNQSISNLHENKILTKFSWNKCAFAGYELKNE